MSTEQLKKWNRNFCHLCSFVFSFVCHLILSPSQKCLKRCKSQHDNSGLTGLLKTAIVRLLRKGIKDPTIAGNYRPISLLSIHYKLASCAITQRIKPAVNIVVGRQQKAYVEGNVIGSCIINLLNMMHNVNEQKKASLILLIDFRKAFDSIDHKFITTVLTELGFKHQPLPKEVKTASNNNVGVWVCLFMSWTELLV